jgi:hypothetical protein
MALDVNVTGISIWKVVVYFIAYLVLHIALGFAVKHIDKKAEEYPNSDELQKRKKATQIAFKWFPAVYVIFILISLN